MSAVRLLVAALCLAVISAALLYTWAERVPDLELRTTPWQTHSGAILPSYPVGQSFVCESDGLFAIDVAVSSDGQPLGEFQLTLSERGSDAGVFRRAVVPIAGVPPQGAYLRFAFEPVADSAGKSYEFRLSPVSSLPRAVLTPYLVYRGQAQNVRPWGDHVAGETELEGSFICEHPDLRAIGIGIVAFDPSAGDAELDLWIAGQDGPPIASIRLAPRVPIENGWAFFSMPVVQESRWKTFRYELRLPKKAQASAGPGGLSMISYHGGGNVSPRLLGMSVRGEELGDRDLVFRAWSKGGAERMLALLRERGGARVAIAWGLWIAASIAILVLLRGASRR